MDAFTTSVSAASSSSSSSQSSRGHCQCEEKGMDKFEHLRLHHPHPPPRPIHSRGRKHKIHRHHPAYPSPAPTSLRHEHCVEHSPMGFPHRPHQKDGKLRVKPPKHLKKIHKLHRKLMKAYKLPKSPRHGVHHHHHKHFPPPYKGFLSTPFGHHRPPGCCLHSMEELEGPSCLHEMSTLHHYHPRIHGRHPHPPCCSRYSLIKSEVAAGEVALANPRGVDVSADPPIEGGAMLLASDMPPADEPAPVIMAP